MHDWLSIPAAAAIFGLLVFLRVKVFQALAGSVGKFFRFTVGLLVPCLSQAMSGRMAASAFHLGVFALTFLLVGEPDLLLNLASAMENVQHTLK